MRKNLFCSFSIILILNCANVLNLFSQDSVSLDFLDQLLKEIETMEKAEKSDESKTPRIEDTENKAVKPEPETRKFDSYSAFSAEEKVPQDQVKKQPVTKDIRDLFLNPDLEQVKGVEKSTKTRPTKESSNALKHYLDELNVVSYSVQNKITNNQNLQPKFKEAEFIEFKEELERTNSLMEIINDKGIYRTAFLKPDKESKLDERASKSSSKNIRKNFLDLLQKLQTLDTELEEPEESEDSDITRLQQLANPKKVRELPKYQPILDKKPTTPETEKSPDTETEDQVTDEPASEKTEPKKENVENEGFDNEEL